MKTITRKKSRTVQAKSAREFDLQFNKTSEELNEDAELVWDGEMCVHFIYEEHEKVPETAEDMLAVRGIHLKCKDCPYRVENPDGRKAGRKDYCPLKFMNQTRADDRACEEFCRQVLAGEAKVRED